MKKIVLVSGKANSGKDTTIDFMIDYLQQQGFKCTKLAFAKYLKDLCRDHMGWNGDKDLKGRTMLQYIGTDKIRDQLGWNEFHCNRVCEDVKIIEDMYDYIFISDARFANELYFTHSKFPNRFADLMVTRPSLVSDLDENQLAHKSENALVGYVHENKIVNDSDLVVLKLKAESFCEFELEV